MDRLLDRLLANLPAIIIVLRAMTIVSPGVGRRRWTPNPQPAPVPGLRTARVSRSVLLS